MLFRIYILLFLVSISSVFGQGTMSTDDNPAAEAEASMSGYTEDQVDLRDEEVELQEDDYDPTVDDEPIQIETNQELMEEYNDEVEQSSP